MALQKTISVWRLVAAVAFALTLLGVLRISVMAAARVECLESLRPCYAPLGGCTTAGEYTRSDYCCIGYSSSRTRVCCQYRDCREWPGCTGSGCIQGVSQPIQSNGPGTGYTNKNCINGRCQ